MAKRKDLVAEMQLLLSSATDQNRVFTDDEQTRYEIIKSTIDRLDEISDIALPAGPVGPTRPIGSPALHLGRENAPGLLQGAIALAIGERGIDTGFAKEFDAEVRRRNPGKKFGAVAMSLKSLLVEKANIGALAGGLAEAATGTQYMDSLFYREGDAIFGPRLAQQLGVNVVVASEDKVSITKLTGTVVPTWIARDGDVPQSDASFDADEIEPKSVGTRITLKRSAILYANHPNVQPLMLRELREAMLNELDRAVLFGEGGLAPVGVSTVATAGHTLATLADAFRIRNAVLSYQKSDDGFKWLLPDLAVGSLATTPLFVGATAATVISGNTLAGYEYVLNPLSAGGSPTIGHQEYLFGNWGYVHLVLFDAVSLLVNPFGSQFASGGLDVRVLADANVYVRDPRRILVGQADILAV